VIIIVVAQNGGVVGDGVLVNVDVGAEVKVAVGVTVSV